MNIALLERAASFLAATDYPRAANKKATAQSLSQDLGIILPARGEPNPDDPASNFYKGFMEILGPLVSSGQPLEMLLRSAFDQFQPMLNAGQMLRDSWAAAYVLASLAAIKAAIDCLESSPSPTVAQPIERKGAQPSELVSILDSIDWDMSKADLRNAFAYMQFIGEHPQQNGIGFSTKINGFESVVVCYFGKKLLSEKLGAVNIVVFQTPPPSHILAKAFADAVDEITARFGHPRLRKSDYVAWVTSGKVIGATTSTGLLGITESCII